MAQGFMAGHLGLGLNIVLTNSSLFFLQKDADEASFLFVEVIYSARTIKTV